MTEQEALVPVDTIDHFVQATRGEILLHDPAPTPLDLAVAAKVAAFIPDRSRC